MRKIINTTKICSSFKYEESHIAHKNMLQRNHNANKAYFDNINKTVNSKPQYTEYRIWGQWKPIKGPIENYEGFPLR